MLNSVLRNPICKVHFAGFESDTLQLQHAGWELSMEQLQVYDGVQLRMALKHEAGRIFAITHPVSSRAMYMLASAASPPPIFNIAWVGNEARFMIFPQPRAMAFSAVSAVPEYERTTEIKFEDAIPFRPLNHSAPEIVIAQQSIPELMELVLKLQDPKQKEIRESRRKEAWRRGESGYEHSEGYKPASDIRAQIISLAHVA